MFLKVNGEKKEVGSSVKYLAQLIAELGINNRFVAVELNGEIVQSDKFETTPVAENDKVEVVTFVGGG